MSDEKNQAQIKVNVEVENAEAGSQVIGVQYRGLSPEEVKELIEKLKPDKDPVWNGEYPYRGLIAFKESDAKFFFGREQLVNKLLEKIQNASFVTITGPSGSGKSSVARAGLLHALRDGRIEKSDAWLLATMQPKDNPFNSLAEALERTTKSAEFGDAIRSDSSQLNRYVQMHLSDDRSQRLVILVDQFEELFTQTQDEQVRKDFITLLTSAAEDVNNRTVVIITLRTDFISNCVAYHDLRELMNQDLQLVGAMEPNDLAKAITMPALAVGSEIDPALVSRVMEDMKGEPGALPLMSFALRDLFEQEKSKKGQPMDLKLEEYLDRGGVEKALERHAESVFKAFDEKQIELTKFIFSRLITIGQERVDTRRTASISELIQTDSSNTEIQAVVDALAREGARLITVSGKTETDAHASDVTVTIAHERLIDAWPWLRELVDQNRDMIALQNQIATDTQEWIKQDRNHEYLYQGHRLLQVEEEWESLEPTLAPEAIEFSKAGIKKRANARRNLYLFIGSIIALLLTASYLAYFANARRIEANENEAKAIAQTTLANAQSLQRGNQLQLSTLLSIISLKNDKTEIGAEELLRKNISRLPIAVTEMDQESGALVEVMFSADGNQLVIADINEGAYVFDISDENDINEIKRFDNGLDELPHAALSSDNQFLAVVDNAYFDNDFSVLLFDFSAEGGPLSLITGLSIIETANHRLSHDQDVIKVTFSDDGTILATASRDNIVRLWDVESGDLISQFETDDLINDIVFSKDGQRLLTGGRGGNLWHLNEDLGGRSFPHDSYVLDVTFSPDESLVATAGTDQVMKIWDSNTGRLLFSNEHDGWVNGVQFSPDGTWIASASEDGRIRVWSTQSLLDESPGNKENKERQLYHDGPVRQLIFSPDPATPWLATTSADRTARLWDIETGQELAIMTLGSEGETLSFSPEGNRLVTTTEGGLWQLWDLSKIPAPLKKQFHDQIISVVSIDQQRNIYYAGGADRAIHSSTANLANATQIEQVNSDQLSSIDISTDGSFLAIGSQDFTLSLWDLEAGSLAYQKNVGATISGIDFHPNGDSFATVDVLGNAALWETGSGTQLFENYHDSQIDLISVAFHPSGESFATGGNDGTIQVWNTDTADVQAKLEHGSQPILDLAYSSDGRWLLTASENGEVRIWESDSLQPRAGRNSSLDTILAHPDAVNRIGVDPNGEWIATGGADGILRLWQVDTWNEVAQIPHASPITAALFSADGTEITTTSANGIFVWQLADIDKIDSQDALIDAACERVTRELSREDRQEFIGDPDARNSEACPG